MTQPNDHYFGIVSLMRHELILPFCSFIPDNVETSTWKYTIT